MESKEFKDEMASLKRRIWFSQTKIRPYGDNKDASSLTMQDRYKIKIAQIKEDDEVMAQIREE